MENIQLTRINKLVCINLLLGLAACSGITPLKDEAPTLKQRSAASAHTHTKGTSHQDHKSHEDSPDEKGASWCGLFPIELKASTTDEAKDKLTISLMDVDDSDHNHDSFHFESIAHGYDVENLVFDRRSDEASGIFGEWQLNTKGLTLGSELIKHTNIMPILVRIRITHEEDHATLRLGIHGKSTKDQALTWCTAQTHADLEDLDKNEQSATLHIHEEQSGEIKHKSQEKEQKHPHNH